MMRRRAGKSADGLVLMTSSVTSSYSADGLREQSQESAGSLHLDARGSDVVEELIQSQATLIPAEFLPLSNTQTSLQDAVFEYPVTSNSSIQSKSLYESAVATQPVASFASSRHGFPDARIEQVAKRSSRSDKPVAKKLTTYEELSNMDVNC
ncbi:flavonol synthase [Dorcoceras hygrometricum]|uniref:Flavonol synthase n=1 Tax=Dorcoceras hygrometricum TaxID=472368 RepID=A0A2Z7AP45_9LAMI|nr:flavonol synthase [Dorcoceras hygrometricum]